LKTAKNNKHPYPFPYRAAPVGYIAETDKDELIKNFDKIKTVKKRN